MTSGPASSLMVNRDAELRLIAEPLNSLVNGNRVSHPILFFHGVQLIGKTTLLRTAQRMAVERGFPAAMIDFDRERLRLDFSDYERYGDDKGRINLAIDLMSALATTADAPPPHPIAGNIDTVDAAAEKLIDYLSWLTSFLKKPTALLFDTIEEADPANFMWLQEQILAPLLTEDKVFIAFAGWARDDVADANDKERVKFIWPILRRMVSHALRPLDSEQSGRQIRSLGEPPDWLQTDILAITGGLPGLNELVVDEAAQSEVDLLGTMVDTVFRRLAGQNAIELKSELLALSTFRQFDLRLLGVIAEKTWPSKYKLLDRAGRRALLKQLMATTLVEQHPDGYGFTVPQDIRRVLNSYEERTNRKGHIDVNSEAVRWFKEEVLRGDPVFVADELYHLAIVWRDASEGHLPVPDQFPDGHKRLTQLTECLQTGLVKLKEHPRADVLPDKIISVLRGPEFLWVMSRSEVDGLIAEVESTK